jgi:hypothetical protein
MEFGTAKDRLPGIWAAIGNMKDPCLVGPDGGEAMPGTKHFRAGAKVHVIAAFWGMGDEVTVIGQHRKSRRYMCVSMAARHIENPRPHLVYSPAIVRLVHEHFAGNERWIPTKDDADKLCALISRRAGNRDLG